MPRPHQGANDGKGEGDRIHLRLGLARLFLPLIVQGDVDAALHHVLRVPIGQAVPEIIKGHNAAILHQRGVL